MQHASPWPLSQLLKRQPPTAAAARYRSTSCFRAPKRTPQSPQRQSRTAAAARHCSTSHFTAPKHTQRQAFTRGRCKPEQVRQSAPCRATSNDEDNLGAAFSEELSRRSDVAAQQLEQEEAEAFDGAALLQVIRDRYDRSYDVTIARRSIAGKIFISLNIMWAYREQASFALTEEEHLNRLDYVAEALRAWGQVRAAKQSIAGQRSRPRVGKAISVQLEVNDRMIQEWFGS